MPTARYGAAGGVINGVLYVAGASIARVLWQLSKTFTFETVIVDDSPGHRWILPSVTIKFSDIKRDGKCNGPFHARACNYGIASGSAVVKSKAFIVTNIFILIFYVIIIILWFKFFPGFSMFGFL